MLEPNPLVNISDLENVEWYYGQSVPKIRQLVVNWKTLLYHLNFLLGMLYDFDVLHHFDGNI